MDQRTLFNTLCDFFISLSADLKMSTRRELRNFLTVFNAHIFSGPNKDPAPDAPLATLITNQRLKSCMNVGFGFLKKFIENMEKGSSGIPVTGGSVESWRMENVAVDIVSHNIKLHKVSEFSIDQLTVKLEDGIIGAKARWPESYLTQSYVLNGFLNGKKATGTGDFKIVITDFTIDIQIKFSETENELQVNDFKLRADFADVQIQVTGLTVEDSSNAEEILNSALQRDQAKLKEALTTNTLIFSEQTTAVLNSKLAMTTKKELVDMITTLCDKNNK